MEKNSNDTVVDDSSYLKETDSEQSFVGKVKSIITNTPLSKWFKKELSRPAVRRRDDDFEDEAQEMQPPSKRVKLPINSEKDNFDSVYSETVIHNDIKKHTKIFDYFPEPVAGPSGIHTNNLANGISISSVHNRLSSSEVLNGRKDSDSEESTSGYSSVAKIGSKEQVYQSPTSSKQTSPSQKASNNARSLFQITPSRSTNTHMNTSLSSRRPSFNASTFGSPNFVDKTLLTKKIINSPFYNGRTIYGGASAYGHNLGRTQQDLRLNLKSSMQIKPINRNNENGNVVLGKTARRILETLEQYNSPVNDAKKIPIVSKKSRGDSMLTKYVGVNPYHHKKGPCNTELNVPNVSDLLKMKHKNKLQDTTEAVRQIATKSKSDLNDVRYKLGGENDKEKHTSKIKTKITTVRQKVITKETVSTINLNHVSLPITTLPKFDFVIPPPVISECSKQSPQNSKNTTSKETIISPNKKVQASQKDIQKRKYSDTENNILAPKTITSLEDFKFSNPLVIAENLKSIAAINNFKFSEPVSKCKKTEYLNVSVNFKMPENKVPTLKPKTKNFSQSKSGTMLKTGSVMDILGKTDSLMESFKVPAGSWECSSCMVQNTPDKLNCVACKSAKITIPCANTKGFDSQFKKSSDKWECPICMIQNVNSDLKCLACTALKPVLTTDLSKKQCNFGNKFKLSSDLWECSVCMVRNKNERTKCASCEAPTPKKNAISSDSSFGSKFKAPPCTWECSTCLVRNNDESTKCIACETSRTNLKIPIANSFDGSFRIKSNEWECGVCLVRNKDENNKCQCCQAAKPGAIVKSDEIKDKPIPTFNFGIDKASAISFNFGMPATTKVEVPKLHVKPSENTTTTSGFSFGIPTETNVKEKSVEDKPVVVETQPKINPLLKPTEKLPMPVETAAPGFQFGLGSSPILPATQLNQNAPKTLTPAETEKTKPIIITSHIKNQIKENIFAHKVDTSKGITISTSAQPVNLFSFGAKPLMTSNLLVACQDDDKKSKLDSNHSVTSTSIFKFGASNKPVSNAAAPVFGSSIVSSSINDYPTTFPKLDTGNPFKMTSPSNTTQVKPFSFGNATTKSDEPPKKLPVFTFESKGQIQPPTQSSGFSFPSTNNSSSFNFTGAKTESSSNIFGGTVTTESTPNGTTGTFNFGSTANNTQKAAGFSFGAASTTAQTPINFGSTPAAASGGFNFSTAPPTFAANAKPSFSVTPGSSVTAFTAQPTTHGGTPAQRKIKKAFRRTQSQPQR